MAIEKRFKQDSMYGLSAKKKWPLYRGGGCAEVAISRLVQLCYIHVTFFFTWISLLSKLPDETENMKHISLKGAEKI